MLELSVGRGRWAATLPSRPVDVIIRLRRCRRPCRNAPASSGGLLCARGDCDDAPRDGGESSCSARRCSGTAQTGHTGVAPLRRVPRESVPRRSRSIGACSARRSRPAPGVGTRAMDRAITLRTTRPGARPGPARAATWRRRTRRTGDTPGYACIPRSRCSPPGIPVEPWLGMSNRRRRRRVVPMCARLEQRHIKPGTERKAPGQADADGLEGDDI